MISFKGNGFDINRAVSLVVFASVANAALAASVDSGELGLLRAEAQRNGAAPVMVHLESVDLSTLKSQRATVRVAMQAKARQLFDELGSEVWSAGRWENGAGQAGMYVTSKGLDILAGTSNARSFFAGKRWNERTVLDGGDGSHEALEASLQRSGVVDVEVTLNVDGLEQSLEPDGRVTFRSAPNTLAAAAANAQALVASLDDAALRNRAAVLASIQNLEQAGGKDSPRLLFRVNRQGVIQLSESASIRSIRPVGHVDRRARHFDLSAIDRARRDGTADVVLVVRNPESGGKLSPASRAAIKRANRAALDSLLAMVGATALVRDFSEFGAAQVRLSAVQLMRLRDSADARLLAVVDNKPVATTQLAVSGPTMNMASAWNAGFRGGGQHVIVFDTGVQGNHLFLVGRLMLEGCFGTTQFLGGVQYISVCPQPDATGDSPLGLVGSADPPFGVNCSTQNPGACSHGTHVSGISAGRTAPNQNAGLQGTAPDGGIIGIQVFSFDQARVVAPAAFFADLLAALQVAAGAIAPNTPASNPYTLNMSIGGGQNAAPCTAAQWTPYITAVQTLRNGGVPVIAATGNESFDAAISAPACIPGVIKVGSVGNDGTGNARSFFNAVNGSNVVNPTAFPGETFWVAPGGGNGTTIQSSMVGGGIGGMSGTSMATPQIAGIYADAKSADPAFTVDDITNYFIGNASVNVAMASRTGAPLNFNLRRILLPTF